MEKDLKIKEDRLSKTTAHIGVQEKQIEELKESETTKATEIINLQDCLHNLHVSDNDIDQ